MEKTFHRHVHHSRLQLSETILAQYSRGEFQGIGTPRPPAVLVCQPRHQQFHPTIILTLFQTTAKIKFNRLSLPKNRGSPRIPPTHVHIAFSLCQAQRVAHDIIQKNISLQTIIFHGRK